MFFFYFYKKMMLAFFGRILTRKKNALLDEKKPMKKYLIVGLGNIGPKYENTRHNIGFKVLDHFAYKENLVFTPGRLGDIATYKLKGRTFLFLKPSTYMNLSGKAVYYWLDKEKIPLENVLIITDDLNLPFGSIRVKTKGSDGGHNGLKDIQAHLGTTNYNRFRFGIDNELSRKNQIDFVLGEWEPEEAKQLPERLDLSLEIIKSFVLAGITNTMNLFNGK